MRFFLPLRPIRVTGAFLAGLIGSLLVGGICASAAATADTRVAEAIDRSGAAINVAALQKFHVLKIDSRVGVAGLPGAQQSWQEIGGRRFAEIVNAAPFIAGDVVTERTRSLDEQLRPVPVAVLPC